jgi:tellurite resistance protein TehA-like permease
MASQNSELHAELVCRQVCHALIHTLLSIHVLIRLYVLSSMGTGIVSILLYNLPYQFNGLHIIAVVIFCLNVALFLSFLTMSM